MGMLEVPISQVAKELDAVSCQHLAWRLRDEGFVRRYQEALVRDGALTAGQLKTIKSRVAICFDCTRGSAGVECSFEHRELL